MGDMKGCSIAQGYNDGHWGMIAKLLPKVVVVSALNDPRSRVTLLPFARRRDDFQLSPVGELLLEFLVHLLLKLHHRDGNCVTNDPSITAIITQGSTHCRSIVIHGAFNFWPFFSFPFFSFLSIYFFFSSPFHETKRRSCNEMTLE